MSTIPVSEVVRVTPGVLAAAGSAVELAALVLTLNTRVPIGTVSRFASVAAVQAFFGEGSLEEKNAEKYFAGFLNSNKKPAAMLFTQYPLAAVGAYLRGADVSGYTLAELQDLSGTLNVTINGVVKTGSVNLSGATSFTNAGQIIADTLAIVGPAAAAFTGSIAATTLTVSAVASGTLGPGQVIAGVGVTASTYILAQLTGTTGGVGTYTVSDSQTASSVAMTSTQPAVTYDSVSGGFKIVSPTTGAASLITFGSGAMATDLKLTSVTGAVLSQGADAGVPGSFMTALVASDRSFATWMLNFNPDVSGNDIRFAFATWNGTQNGRYAFSAIDDDMSPTTDDDDDDCLAKRISAAEIEGVICNWQTPDDDITNPTAAIDYGNLAAFACGYAGSIDFDQLNGRVVAKFRRQSGLVPTVTDQTVFDNLKANGYNCYGAFADGDEEFTWYVDGVISGDFIWMDSYLNQIALNTSFRNSLVVLLQNAYSIPYNAAGRALIEAALADTINKYLAFGAYRAGVTLSASQIAAVNASAGRNISDTLTNQGWYLLIGNASSEVRQARGTPPITFYYVDGQSVQEFDMASIALQ